MQQKMPNALNSTKNIFFLYLHEWIGQFSKIDLKVPNSSSKGQHWSNRTKNQDLALECNTIVSFSHGSQPLCYKVGFSKGTWECP